MSTLPVASVLLVIVLAIVLAVVWVLAWRFAWRYLASHRAAVRPLAVVEMIVFALVLAWAILSSNVWVLAPCIVGVVEGAVTYRTKWNWWRGPRTPQHTEP